MIPILKPTKLRHYVNIMRSRGFGVDKVLADTGITEDRLFDPGLLVDSHQYEVVVRNMINLTQNPELGFEIGSGVQLVDFGILAHAMMSARNLRDAILLWQRYCNLAGLTLKMRIEEAKNNWMVVIDILGTEGQIQRFCIEESLMHAVTLGAALVGRPFTLGECTLTYPSPPYASRYRELLSCPVRFNAPRTALTVVSPGLDSPLRGYDPEFNEVCLRHCGQIMRQIRDGSTVASQIRSILLSKSGEIPSLEHMAVFLGFSSRTLKRSLAREGASYQAIVNEFRLDLAQEYLKSEQLTPKEIGFLLGFKSITSFRRAFKSWTGKTILEFRNETPLNGN